MRHLKRICAKALIARTPHSHIPTASDRNAQSSSVDNSTVRINYSVSVQVLTAVIGTSLALVARRICREGNSSRLAPE
jgi:hypothetical protein